MTSLLRKLLKHVELESEIFEAFGYEEDWRRFPIQLELDRHWLVTGLGNNRFVSSPEPFTAESIESGEEIYSAEVYTYCHLKQHVWHTDTHTMALLDPGCDGNVWLAVFDNALECKDKELAELYDKTWGCG